MKMHKHGLLYGKDVSPEVEASYGNLLRAQVDQDISPVLDGFDRRFAAIGDDSRLTAAGKLHARRQLGADTHTVIEKNHAFRRQKFASDLKALNLPNKLPTTTELAAQRKESPEVLFHQHKEIRDALKKQDPVIRRSTLAANSGDTDMVLACAGCHPLVRPVNENVANEATKAWLSSQLPKEAHVIRDALNIYDGNTQTAQKHIASKSGVRASDDVTRAALDDPTEQPDHVIRPNIGASGAQEQASYGK